MWGGRALTLSMTCAPDCLFGPPLRGGPNTQSSPPRPLALPPVMVTQNSLQFMPKSFKTVAIMCIIAQSRRNYVHFRPKPLQLCTWFMTTVAIMCIIVENNCNYVHARPKSTKLFAWSSKNLAIINLRSKPTQLCPRLSKTIVIMSVPLRPKPPQLCTFSSKADTIMCIFAQSRPKPLQLCTSSFNLAQNRRNYVHLRPKPLQLCA